MTGATAVDELSKADGGPFLQIGAVAQLVGLSLRTVRHYDEAGLIGPAARTGGGFRLYDHNALTRLLLIKQMKPLGFTLEEMRLLVETRDRLADPSIDADSRAQLQQVMALFAATVTDKVRQLRDRVATAEDFAARLRHDVVA